MMNISAYIRSGILEEYCLGLLNEEDTAFLMQMTMLYPEVTEELKNTEYLIEELAIIGAVEPATDLKNNILDRLGFEVTIDKLDIHNLPMIDYRTDSELWLNTFAHLIPKITGECASKQVLREDPEISQALVTATTGVIEDGHTEFRESFLVLKGSCECCFGDVTFKMTEGGFLEIPLYLKHEIKITSPHIIAILQRVAI